MRRRQTPTPRIWKTQEVFVAGELPTITYNPRDDHRLEGDVRDYRDQGGKALCVSGPSKSGKTVLIERLFSKNSAIWVEGSDLTSIDAFWRRLADGLQAFDQLTLRGEHGEGRSTELGGEVGLKGLKGTGRTSKSSSSAQGSEASRSRPLPDLVRDELDNRAWPIVVDDFQYVPTQVRRAIAQTLRRAGCRCYQ